MANAEVKDTKEYSKFKILEGNRVTDDNHIKRLQRLMLTSGNLTQQFPVVINQNWEVIDGQHRIKALEQLGWPVFYIVKEDLNLQDVRAINIGHRNWTWKDYAISFAELGNKNYERLLALHEEFGTAFHTLMQYTSLSHERSITHNKGVTTSSLGYRMGEFKLDEEQYNSSRVLLAQLEEAMEVSGIKYRQFQSAMYWIMTEPSYDHARMLEKLEKYGAPHLNRARRVEDFLRALEDTYNTYVRDEEKVRLF